MVGSFRHRGNDGQTGAAYVFNRRSGEWSQGQKLIASDAKQGDWFGVSVSLRDDLAAVGATLVDGEAGDYSGSVYFLAFDGFEWTEISRITPSAAWGVSHFGSSVAVSGEHIIVGADDRLAVIPASAYAFDLAGDDCDGNHMCDDREMGGYPYQAGSFRFSPVGSGGEHDFILESPPEAIGEVGLTVNAVSDLDQPDERIDVWLEGVPVGSAFAATGGLCADPPDGAELTVGADLFNALRTDLMHITLVPSAAVSPLACADRSSAGITVRYEAKPAGDCNGNGVLDVCDVTGGISDDEDGDGVPDECGPCLTNADCSDGGVCRFVQCLANACRSRPASYGDLVGLGGTCGPDGTVDLHDVIAAVNAFQGVFVGGCSTINADLAGPRASCIADGVVDLLDILAVLGAFGGDDPCCGL